MSELYNPYAEQVPGPSSPLSPNRTTREKLSRGDTYDMKNLPHLPSSPSGLRLGYYPTSLLILTAWIVFVVVLLWLLESAVTNGPRSLSQPWSFTTLPSLLITVFAQGHGAITAMHLARVSVSALHSSRTSPNTWAEVFWISDRAWQGPVGIFTTVLAASRLRVRTSSHFILCAVTCLTALVTPIILSRAYPIRSITVREASNITPFALDMDRMGAVDAYAEIGTGVGSWTTALSVSDTYNTSVYLPPGASRSADPTDFFFAGNVDGKTATLPGLRLTGQCTRVESNVSDITVDFPAYCQAQMQTTSLAHMSKPINLSPPSVNLTMRACVNGTWENIFLANPAQRSDVAYIFINSNNNTAADNPGIAVSGMIRCDTSISTGRASLSGANGTFSEFTEEQLYNETQAGEPLLEPLFALLYYLENFQTTDVIATASVVRALGFVGLSPSGGVQTYAQPSIDEMATGLWRGVSYVLTGIGLLSRTNDTSYDAIQSGLVAVYVREPHFASAAYALLAVWLLLLVIVTARSFRPTFGGSFDSYITAKLVLDKPGLVESAGGELTANTRLREPFGCVRRDDLGRVVVAEQ
ncbi:hypothetical protein C8R43DRAFT_923915 [Mycena crocata]|nr:hypothetical protein C8R43DRAFT_923915 [Mycena crocata]